MVGTQIALPKVFFGNRFAYSLTNASARPTSPHAARAIAEFQKRYARSARAIPLAVPSFTCSQFPNTASVIAWVVALRATYSFALRPSAASKARLENARACRPWPAKAADDDCQFR